MGSGQVVAPGGGVPRTARLLISVSGLGDLVLGQERRERGQTPRAHVVTVKLSAGEKAALEDAAAR
jgi:hypothetical protein